jgi:uncharacterized damage-inducible protein DinB
LDTEVSVALTEHWRRLNVGLIDLVDVIPDDKLDWSPREDLWGLRRILTHVAAARHKWLTREGMVLDDLLAKVRTREDVKAQLRESWERVEGFLSEQRYLDRVYEGSRGDIAYKYSGHWIAFHLLEHDIHHRADVFHYLALLDIEHPEVDTP